LFHARVDAADLSSATVAMATTAAPVATLVNTEMAATVVKALPVPRGSMELMLPNQAAPGPTVATEAMAVTAATAVRAARFLAMEALAAPVALAASVVTAVTALPVPRE
jgi:hypothetical protein